MSNALSSSPLADNEIALVDFLAAISNNCGEEIKLVDHAMNHVDRVIKTSGSHLKIDGTRLYIPNRFNHSETINKLRAYSLAH